MNGQIFNTIPGVWRLAPVLLLLASCQPLVTERLQGSDVCVENVQQDNDPALAGFAEQDLARIDSVILTAIADSAFPGASVSIGTPTTVAYSRGYGTLSYSDPDSVHETTVYDLASMTKVVATTTSAMLLYEAGALDLDARVTEYLPEFGESGKDDVRVIHLLTHTSGLIPFRPYHLLGLHERSEILGAIMSDSLQFEPGTRVSYSDLGMITMGRVIEEIAGMTLDSFSTRYIFNPLGMCSTAFRSSNQVDVENIAPTEVDTLFRKSLVHGVVHDETAYILGGTAGHAGLFATAADLSKFATMMLTGNTIDGKPFLARETISRFTSRPAGPGQQERAIGWDLRSLEGYTSAGEYFSRDSFGHTGYTGTSIWIDPELDVYAILLTNRVHPTRANRKISAVRPAFASAVGLPLVSKNRSN
ncbi:MAG: beta-lactamase family protein [Rhodothermales bacterium]|nr:beta-lactamase family protein [Rhodothermales bacterium]